MSLQVTVDLEHWEYYLLQENDWHNLLKRESFNYSLNEKLLFMEKFIRNNFLNCEEIIKKIGNKFLIARIFGIIIKIDVVEFSCH